MISTAELRLGLSGHQSTRMGKDEWLTPPHILAALGTFDLDPCAPMKPPWEIAGYHYTVKDNGLHKRWFGRVWLNPPYGTPEIIGPWMRRMAEHNCGTALIFARTETKIFFDTVWGRACGLLFLRNRIFFHHVDGRRASHNAGAPSVLVAYGQDDCDRLAASDLNGKFVRLSGID